MRLNETDTLQFVQVYMKHEGLWNPAHPGYKMKHLRDKAYSDVSDEFKEWTGKQMSVSEVKLKIKNLRTTYYQQVDKIIKKSTPKEIYEPTLVWFHEMDKCLKNIPSHRRVSNVNASSAVTEEADSSQIWFCKKLLEDPNTTKPDPLMSQTIDDYQSTSLADSDYVPKSNDDSSMFNYKKLKKKKRKLAKEGSSNYIEDEFDIYGKFIASQLRSMSLRKALQLQLAIQSMINDARISESNEQNI